MIICIVENCGYWDDFGEPFLVDTSKLNNSYLKDYLENNTKIVITNTHPLGGVHEFYSYSFASEYGEDLQQAEVKPPQMVDKLISIIFE